MIGMYSALLFLPLLLLSEVTKVEAFCGIKLRKQHLKYNPWADRRKTLYGFQYGRGDEIWPPTNEDFSIELSDSLVDPMKRPKEPTKFESRRSMVFLSSILISTIARVDQVSYLPLDALILIALSGYFLLLHRLEILPTPTSDDTAMMVLYKEPLGPILGRRLEVWNSIGLYAGIVLPYLFLYWEGGASWQSVVIRPLLLYCVQTLTEKFCEDSALPIRALVPIMYTALRLCYWIYFAMTLDSMPGAIVLTLGVINLVYCCVTLLLVLPYLALRYMRVHCFLVEAKSVELRSEISVGLTPR